MFYLFFLLFLILCFGLYLSVYQSGEKILKIRIYRIFAVVFAVTLFSFYFVNRSLTQFQQNALTLQLINALPLPLDFYVIKIDKEKEAEKKFETRHIGTVRSNHFRIDYLDMKNSDEFWIAGLMGKKSLVYFSQHAVPNKNEDQIIEIHNYINQSLKLSDISKELIADKKLENMRTAVWITLDLLLLFLNFSLLLKKSKAVEV